jgi:hypothetical protein
MLSNDGVQSYSVKFMFMREWLRQLRHDVPRSPQQIFQLQRPCHPHVYQAFFGYRKICKIRCLVYRDPIRVRIKSNDRGYKEVTDRAWDLTQQKMLQQNVKIVRRKMMAESSQLHSMTSRGLC